MVSVWQVLDKNYGWNEKALFKKKGLNVFVYLGNFAKVPSSQERNHQFVYCNFCCGLPKSSVDPWRVLPLVQISWMNDKIIGKLHGLFFMPSLLGTSEGVCELFQVNLKGCVVVVLSELESLGNRSLNLWWRCMCRKCSCFTASFCSQNRAFLKGISGVTRKILIFFHPGSHILDMFRSW